MKVKVYMQDWFFNAGIVGFKNILKHAENDFTVVRKNFIEFDTEHLRNFHEYYFKYFFDRYNVAEKMEKRISQSFNNIKKYIELETADKDEKKKAQDRVKAEKKYIKTSIKTQLDKIKKIDEDIYSNMNEKYNEIDSIKENDDLEKLDVIQESLMSGFNNEKVNKRITLNLFKSILSKNYFGQVSFLNVLKTAYTYEEQEKIMYMDYIQDIIECGFLNDMIEDRYNVDEIKEYINSNIENMNKNFQTIYSNIIRKYIDKGIEKVKEYIKTSVLDTCSLCGSSKLKTIDYSEGSFVPLAISSDNMRNFFWNQNAKFPICNLCNLILFCVPAGITSITKIVKDNGVYKERETLSFVNYDTSLNELVKTNNNFSDISKKGNSENNTYSELIIDIVEQDKKLSKWKLQNIFVVEFDVEYGAYCRMNYFNIKTYMAKFFVKYSNKTLNCISDYRYKLQLVDYILKNKDISKVINTRLLEEINSDKKIENGYNSFLATRVRLILNLLKKEELGMEENIEKNNKKLFVLYNMGIEIHEVLKSKNEDNKLNGFTYKMLNSIKSGNKKEFMDIVIRIHMFMQRDISPIFLEVMQDGDLDFESIGHSFVSGLISNKFDKVQENKE